MSPKPLPLTLAPAILAETDESLTKLEALFAPFVSLTPKEARRIVRMGGKSLAFCRKTLELCALHPERLPPDFDLAGALQAFATLDALRDPVLRLRELLALASDTQVALGSKVMTTALAGYKLMQLFGEGGNVDALREAMQSRRPRRPRRKQQDDAGPAPGAADLPPSVES